MAIVEFFYRIRGPGNACKNRSLIPQHFIWLACFMLDGMCRLLWREVMRSAWKLAVASLMLLISAAGHATIVATNATYGLFDGSAGTRILSVGTHGIITDLDLIITLAKCDDPPIGPNGTDCIGQGRSFDREIILTLTGPDGTRVRIVDAGTYTGRTPGAGKATIRFDDQAEFVVGGSVTPGTFRPIGLLGSFNGQDMFGNYFLSITDGASEDPLEFFSASLDVTVQEVVGEVPEPGALALLGLGLGLLGMTSWRKKKAPA
jgi:hypothetical protein